jgi:hypothetical protein
MYLDGFYFVGGFRGKGGKDLATANEGVIRKCEAKMFMTMSWSEPFKSECNRKR